MRKVTLLNVNIDNFSKTEFLAQLKQGVVFTPNVDHLIKLQHDQDFLSAYEAADYRVCDSRILMLSSRFLGTPIKEKISGSDLLPDFCTYHKNDPGIKIFLLGGMDGVARKAQQRINEKLNSNIIVGAHSPSYGFEKNEAECQEIIKIINQSGATVLAVGVGAPKQELWITRYKSQLPNVKVFLAVGAAIDFAAGQKSRSPQWISEAGLEWLYRLFSEPRRLWKRYLVDDMPFFWLILKQRFNLYRFPNMH